MKLQVRNLLQNNLRWGTDEIRLAKNLLLLRLNSRKFSTLFTFCICLIFSHKKLIHSYALSIHHDNYLLIISVITLGSFYCNTIIQVSTKSAFHLVSLINSLLHFLIPGLHTVFCVQLIPISLLYGSQWGLCWHLKWDNSLLWQTASTAATRPYST